MTYQILESELCNVARLDAQVGKGLCPRVNNLIKMLPDDLIPARRWPPQQLVQNIAHRCHDLAGDVNVAAGLHDLLLNKLPDLRQGVPLGAEELVGLAGGRVIVQHLLECSANIDDVNRRTPLLEVV